MKSKALCYQPFVFLKIYPPLSCNNFYVLMIIEKNVKKMYSRIRDCLLLGVATTFMLLGSVLFLMTLMLDMWRESIQTFPNGTSIEYIQGITQECTRHHNQLPFECHSWKRSMSFENLAGKKLCFGINKYLYF